MNDYYINSIQCDRIHDVMFLLQQLNIVIHFFKHIHFFKRFQYT